MAIRSQELLEARAAIIVRFPTERVRARAARRRVIEKRRLALAACTVAVAGAVLLGGAGESAVSSMPGAPDAVVLRQGQTLWDLAVRYAPDGVDPRAYVEELERINGLHASVPAGMRLELPN